MHVGAGGAVVGAEEDHLVGDGVDLCLDFFLKTRVRALSIDHIWTMLRVHLGAIFRPHLNDIKSAFGRYLESHLDVVLVYVWTIFRL